MSTVTDATPANIAHALAVNSEAHVAGLIDHATWKANQNRLWAEAAQQHIASDVLRIVCPSLTEKV